MDRQTATVDPAVVAREKGKITEKVIRRYHQIHLGEPRHQFVLKLEEEGKNVNSDF